MTLDEVADSISRGLKGWQREANLYWLTRVWKSLKMGGVWYYPLDTSMWVKTEEGFDRADDTYIADPPDHHQTPVYQAGQKELDF